MFKKPIMLALFFFLLGIMPIYAQNDIAICQDQCLREKCYSYSDCKPNDAICKDTNLFCCVGSCNEVQPSPDDTVNLINEKLTEVMETNTDLQREIEKIRENVIKIDIFGTEYQADDNGTIFLQLLNESKLPINDALCFIDIYNPDKSVLINDGIMMYLNGSDGLYYYDLIIPDNLGIYMVSAKCDFHYNITMTTSIKDSYIASGNPDSNYGNLTYMIAGTIFTTSFYYSLIQFNLTNLNNVEEALLFLYETSSYKPKINLYRITSNWNESNVTWNTAPLINNYVWNSRQTNGVGWYYWNITNLIKGWINGTYANYGMMLNSTNTTGTFNFSSFSTRENANEYVPKLLVKYISTQGITEIKGAGEIHVNSKINITFNQTELIQQIWSYPNRTTEAINLNAFNQSIFNKLYKIQDEIASVNNTMLDEFINTQNLSLIIFMQLIETNESIMNKLYSMQSELSNILAEILNLSWQFNVTNTSLWDIYNEVNGLGSQISNVNASIFSKLYKIQDEIKSVNDTTLATNQTIMLKLYSIQNDLDNLLANLTYQLANLTNITIDITGNLSGIFDPEAVWEMFFQRGTPPLMPSTEYFCSDNFTLVKDITFEWCEAGNCKNYTKTEDIVCPYGCDNGTFTAHAECKPSPPFNYAIIMVIVAAIFGFLYWVFKR